ncbi:hypothetical protein E2C01_024775 [Portunus trituberculatus]|uniref:Uncharacterized protein n=1 Tax=Portunus trituberculatus TaxID=210409 RepID=A0A5B7EDQ1_PORTR|nr:hypothetical protein [Portunus trituberculatus]
MEVERNVPRVSVKAGQAKSDPVTQLVAHTLPGTRVDEASLHGPERHCVAFDVLLLCVLGDTGIHEL